MPLSLVEVAANSATVAIAWGDDPNALTVEYYPGRITEKALSIAQMMGDNLTDIVAGFRSFNEVLADMIKSWDLYVDAERTQLFPIDAARFPEIPVGLRQAVFKGIMSDVRPESAAQAN